MAKIIVYTQAYNSEKTLSRAIASIERQTYDDWEYHIVNNASIDKTAEILSLYASDPRFIITETEKNEIKYCYKYLAQVSRSTDADWICWLDADDEYEPDFLEKMLEFVTDNNLDVATCGNTVLDAETGEIIKLKIPDSNMILVGQDFAEQFPVYRNYMVAAWCALFSMELLRRCDFTWANSIKNFGDCAYCMETFRRATRAGVLAGSLHKYYIAPETISTSYDSYWFESCKYIYEISREYLLDYGEISKRNEDYLHVIIMIMIKYIIPIIQRADIQLSKKLFDLLEIFSDPKIRYILKHWEDIGLYSSKSGFLSEIEEWIYMQDDWESSGRIVNEILSAMKMTYKDGTLP